MSESLFNKFYNCIKKEVSEQVFFCEKPFFKEQPLVTAPRSLLRQSGTVNSTTLPHDYNIL